MLKLPGLTTRQSASAVAAHQLSGYVTNSQKLMSQPRSRSSHLSLANLTTTPNSRIVVRFQATTILEAPARNESRNNPRRAASSKVNKISSLESRKTSSSSWLSRSVIKLRQLTASWVNSKCLRPLPLQKSYMSSSIVTKVLTVPKARLKMRRLLKHSPPNLRSWPILS